MTMYTHGASLPLAEQILRQGRELTRRQRATLDARRQAVRTINEANTAAHRIINASITAADKIRHDAEKAGIAIRATAEHEASRIRERAYLEGRALADTRRIEHDKKERGNQRRAQLENSIRRNA